MSHFRLETGDLFQQLKGGLGIDPFTLNGDELETIEIKRTLKVEPLATRSGFNRRLLVLWEPTMGWTALILGMHSIQKQNVTTQVPQRRSTRLESSIGKVSIFYQQLTG